MLTFEDFGAFGDGITDDTAAIAACIAEALATGRPIRANAGRYLVTGPVCDVRTPSSGAAPVLSLTGAGRGQTVLLPRGLSAPLFTVWGDRSRYGGPRVKDWKLADFGVEGDGQPCAEVFHLAVCSQLDICNLRIWRHAGPVLYAAEVWDSLVDLSAVRCGTPDRPVIELQGIWGTANSGCNNIVFPATAQVEAAAGVGMVWGPWTRKCRFAGKIHGATDHAQPAPHLVLDGARENMIAGANLAEADGPCIRITNAGGVLPTDNLISGCQMLSYAGPCVAIEAGRRNIVTANALKCPGDPVTGAPGAENLTDGNVWTVPK